MQKRKFSESVLEFNAWLSNTMIKLPNNYSLCNPFRGANKSKINEISTFFYNKYYNDDKKRYLILGSSPARKGTSVTGIPFEDANHLYEETGITTSLKNGELISINGVNLCTNIQELEDVITYGTFGKRKYELEKCLFNRYILFGIPSLRDSEELVFKIEDITGKRIMKSFGKDAQYTREELFDYDEYRYGQNSTYSSIDNCLIYNHSSVQKKFKNQIERAVNSLRGENLTGINTIIIDIRGNTGGDSALNKILMDFLLEQKDKKLNRL